MLNLSLGQAGVASHVGDPLWAAVERAWDAGIVVVAAGNRGASQPHLDSPAIDPYVIAMGGAAREGVEGPDWVVPAWSAIGTDARMPGVVALGRSIASYRVPGSTPDELKAALGQRARICTRLMLWSRGTG